jgi:hypothetical protein
MTDRSAPSTPPAAAAAIRLWPVWLVLLAAAGTFALTMGTRQSMGLFLGPLNTWRLRSASCGGA